MSQYPLRMQDQKNTDNPNERIGTEQKKPIYFQQCNSKCSVCKIDNKRWHELNDLKTSGKSFNEIVDYSEKELNAKLSSSSLSRHFKNMTILDHESNQLSFSFLEGRVVMPLERNKDGLKGFAWDIISIFRELMMKFPMQTVSAPLAATMVKTLSDMYVSSGGDQEQLNDSLKKLPIPESVLESARSFDFEKSGDSNRVEGDEPIQAKAVVNA